jgi:hypothetical protein
MAVVGNGFQPFRQAALRQAQGDLPLPPPAGEKSDVGRVKREAIGDGSWAIGKETWNKNPYNIIIMRIMNLCN